MLDLREGGWPGSSHVCGGPIVSEFELACYNREDVAAHVLGILRAQSDDQTLNLYSTAIVRVGADGRFAITTMAGPGLHRTHQECCEGPCSSLSSSCPCPALPMAPTWGASSGHSTGPASTRTFALGCVSFSDGRHPAWRFWPWTEIPKSLSSGSRRSPARCFAWRCRSRRKR